MDPTIRSIEERNTSMGLFNDINYYYMKEKVNLNKNKYEVIMCIETYFLIYINGGHWLLLNPGSRVANRCYFLL